MNACAVPIQIYEKEMSPTFLGIRRKSSNISCSNISTTITVKDVLEVYCYRWFFFFFLKMRFLVYSGDWILSMILPLPTTTVFRESTNGVPAARHMGPLLQARLRLVFVFRWIKVRQMNEIVP